MSYPQVSASATGGHFCKTLHHDTYPAIDPATKSNLKGRSVFISGANKGVGRATALAYASAGTSKIAIAARSEWDNLEEEMLAAAKKAGHPAPRILMLHLDVQLRDTVKAAATEVKDKFGDLDILINNAGYLEKAQTVLESDEDDYWSTWEINYRGVYWVTKDFLPLLLGTTDGLKTVLNVSSIGAHGLRPGHSAYQTTKNALLRFTEFLMAEYFEEGLLSYAIHPGGVRTKLGLRLPTQTQVGLIDAPELSASTIVFLTQNKKDWLAGRYISVCWDMEEFLSREKEIVDGDKLKMRLVV